jgi:hypothetical protein
MNPDLSPGLAAGQYSQPAGSNPNFQTPAPYNYANPPIQTGNFLQGQYFQPAGSNPNFQTPAPYNYANPPIQTGNFLQGQYGQPAGGIPNFQTPVRPMGGMINPMINPSHQGLPHTIAPAPVPPQAQDILEDRRAIGTRAPNLGRVRDGGTKKPEPIPEPKPALVKKIKAKFESNFKARNGRPPTRQQIDENLDSEVIDAANWLNRMGVTELERVLRMYVYDHGVRGASQQEMDPIFDFMGIDQNLVAQDLVKVSRPNYSAQCFRC